MSPDVLVRGFGPAGAAAAITLARAGCRVSVSHLPRAVRTPGETLGPGALPVLEETGVTRQFLDECPKVESTGVVSCWGSPLPAMQDYLLQPGGTGWHIDRDAFDEMLRQEALRAGARMAEGDQSAPFVIDATGRSSRREPGEAPDLAADSMTALVRYWTGARPAAYALIEAHPDGWSYCAPIPGGGMISAFHCDPELARAHRGGAELWDAISPGLPCTAAFLGGAEPSSAWRWVSARSSRRARVARPGWLAAGDAAVSWDPLSGAGIANALRSGRKAAETALAFLGGQHDALDQYQEETETSFSQYLGRRKHYYRTEDRWPDAPFWSRRRNPCPRFS